MEIVKIDGMGNEEIMKNHLESLIDKKMDGKIVIWGHKHKVVVNEDNLFYWLTKKSKNKDLAKLGGLHYIEKINEEYWTICLENNLTGDFIKKYGGEYRIN